MQTILFRIRVTLKGSSLLFNRGGSSWAVTLHNNCLIFISRGIGAGVNAQGASFPGVLPAQLSCMIPFSKADCSEAVRYLSTSCKLT